MQLKVKSLRYVGAFVCGAASYAAAVRIYRQEDGEQERQAEVTPAQMYIARYGFPVTGAEVRLYANHALSYDQVRKTPRWVAEHLSSMKLQGNSERKHCKFRPDPAVPELFTAHNEDYLGSGWSRGHMAPAGDNKFSLQAMAETFYLSNIVPQNYENNAGFWNRLEMYCRDLTKRFEDVWVISGPLTLPEAGENGKKTITYQLIGKDEVAVPTHLYKVILVQKSHSSPVLALGAFVVPNQPIGFDRPLTDFQVSLTELEKMSGITFFPSLGPKDSVLNLCQLDSCKLLDFRQFMLYIAGRKLSGARSFTRLSKTMEELREMGVEADDYLLQLYKDRRAALEAEKAPEGKPT